VSRCTLTRGSRRTVHSCQSAWVDKLPTIHRLRSLEHTADISLSAAYMRHSVAARTRIHTFSLKDYKCGEGSGTKGMHHFACKAYNLHCRKEPHSYRWRQSTPLHTKYIFRWNMQHNSRGSRPHMKSHHCLARRKWST
jgi:hypothetical protein